MSLVQHICKFFCIEYYVQNLFFHLLAFILSYQLILCLFEAFRFFERISHPLKKVRLEMSGSLYLGHSEWDALPKLREPAVVYPAVNKTDPAKYR